MEVKATVRDNGPILVTGGLIVVDGAGNPYEIKDVVALCRCGHSGDKPFCDGTHKRCGWDSQVRAEA